MPKKKFLFIVQSQGRGHLCQSIVMQDIILSAGMEICEVFVGKSEGRIIPDFYYEKIKCPITAIDSPNFVTDKKGKSVKIFASVIKNLLQLSTFRKSLKVIDEKIKEHQPDMIINFYDPLMGLYYMLNKPKVNMICIAHQYLLNHSEFEFPKGHFLDRINLKSYTSLTCYGAYKKIALSFYKFPDDVDNDIYVVPPLLREEIFQQKTDQGNYLLVYLVNAGYLEEIISWHKRNNNVEMHCFVDSKYSEAVETVNGSLFIHKLNDKKFIEMMAGCKGLVTTAGFESICEAMYLKKQVLMVPVEGHFEQYLNSFDGQLAGAGIRSDSFQIRRFIDYLATHRNNNMTFSEWAEQANTKILNHLIS